MAFYFQEDVALTMKTIFIKKLCNDRQPNMSEQETGRHRIHEGAIAFLSH